MKAQKFIRIVLAFALFIGMILPGTTLQASAAGSNVASIAAAQVGTVTGAPNKYTQYTGKVGNTYGYHWCCAFVSWCAAEAGEAAAVPKSASCANMRNYVYAAGGRDVSASEVQAGDLVFYYCSALSAPWAHIGIMINRTESVEGNMGGNTDPSWKSSQVKKSQPSWYRITSNKVTYSVANGKVKVYYIRPNYSGSAPVVTNLPAHANNQNVTPGRYNLVNAATGYYMNYAYSGWSGLSYKPMIMSRQDGSPEQIFELSHTGSGLYAINVKHPDGGVVNVYRDSGSAQIGDAVTQWKWSGSNYQKFWFTKLSNGNYIIQSATDPTKVLAPPTNEWHAHLRIATYQENNTLQQWKLAPLDGQSPAPSAAPAPVKKLTIAEGTYHIVNASSNYYMNYAYSGWKGLSYKPMCMSSPDGTPEQNFRLKHTGDGQYAIEILHPDGGVVNVYRGTGNAQAGDPVTQWTSSGSAYQRFYVTPVGNDRYILQSATDPSKVIATPTNDWHALLTMADYNAADSKQQWIFSIVSLPVATIEMSNPDVYLDMGGTKLLDYNVTPVNATDARVTWQSSNPNVATINDVGLVTGLRPGIVTITATTKDGTNLKASCTVHVNPPSDSGATLHACIADIYCPSSYLVDAPKPSNWAHEPIDWAIMRGITNGTDPTHFSPGATCTRGQVVTFLWRAQGCPEPSGTDNPFTDVKKGAFYYKAVLWAVENGITKGVDATHFRPNQGCTRGQIVTFLWRAEGQKAPESAANPFTDVTGGYYYNAVLWAVEKEITNGTSATTFSPDASCTRAQIVAFLYRDMN